MDQRIAKAEVERSRLAKHTEFYTVDVELDEIMTAYKLMFRHGSEEAVGGDRCETEGRTTWGPLVAGVSVDANALDGETVDVGEGTDGALSTLPTGCRQGASPASVWRAAHVRSRG